MSLSLTIRQQGSLFGAAVDVAALRKLLGSAVSIGGIGPSYSFLPEPAAPAEGHRADYMMYGRKSPLGRGFYAYVGRGRPTIELITALPTTVHDLEDLFTVAGALASYVGTKTIYRADGQPLHVAELPSYYAEVTIDNCELLKSYTINRPRFAVSSVRYPLIMPEKLCQRIAAVPADSGVKFFSAYLSEKQALGQAYLWPHLVAAQDGAPAHATYALSEGVATVIPKVPFVPYGPDPLNGQPPAEGQVTLVAAKLGALGTIPYPTFLERLKPTDTQPFDDEHYLLRALPLDRLQRLLDAPA